MPLGRMLRDARDNGIKALPTSSKPLALDPRNVEILNDAAWNYTMLRQFPTRAKAP